MGFQYTDSDFNKTLELWAQEYTIYAPKIFEGDGTFSDTDVVRYGEISKVEEIEFNNKSLFSYKETLLPINQTLFFFSEDGTKEALMNQRKLIVFLRSCDFNAVKRLDEIYLRNKFEDAYYKKIRENTAFIVMECHQSFENCFCVSMGTNTCSGYDAYLKKIEGGVVLETSTLPLEKSLNSPAKNDVKVNPPFVSKNKLEVNVPSDFDLGIVNSDVWDEYNVRCIDCGRCNFVCPTCTCFTMQDIFYRDNQKCGERRRVWASCKVDGYTDIAGGISYRQKNGQRMRFKVMHKVYDFKKRFGYNMCVGCGRCDDVCPEYISYSSCINKLNKAMEGVR
ncbi:MAG: anaerobic sulfite reductase subunit AsrA [Treponema sp.]|nr:anaerobic sulfite reductase subunit AsrA [Treponema sp.]